MDLDDSFAAASASVNQVKERLRQLREILLASPGEVAASYAEAIDTSVGMAGELLQILAAQQARQSRHNRPTKTTIMATGSKSGTPGDMSAVYSYDYADRQATLGLQGNTRRTLEEALALSRRALYEDALTLLDKALVDARQAQDRRAVVVFARNAGIISSGEGDFQRAMAYYSEALENGPDDLYMYIALADSNQRLGNNEAALDLLSHCRQAALLQGDEDILAILRAQGI